MKHLYVILISVVDYVLLRSNLGWELDYFAEREGIYATLRNYKDSIKIQIISFAFVVWMASESRVIHNIIRKLICMLTPNNIETEDL